MIPAWGLGWAAGIGAAVVAAAAGWWVRDTAADRDLAELRARHAGEAVMAQRQLRQIEDDWESRHEQIVAQAELRAASAERELAGAGAALDRLRHAAAAAQRYAAARAAAACGGDPAPAPGVVLADVPEGAGGAAVELGGIAVELAHAYDRARAAGLACEQAYGALRGPAAPD